MVSKITERRGGGGIRRRNGGCASRIPGGRASQVRLLLAACLFCLALVTSLSGVARSDEGHRAGDTGFKTPHAERQPGLTAESGGGAGSMPDGMSGEFRIVTSAMPPFSSLDVLGTPQGMCMEVALHVARELGRHPTVVERSKPRFLLEFERGSADMLPCSSAEWMSPVRDHVVFSKPILEMENVVLARKGAVRRPGGPDCVAGCRVGTLPGYVYADGFDDAFAHGNMQREDTPGTDLMLRKLSAGRLDAAIVNILEARYWGERLNLPRDAFEVVYTFKRKVPVSLVLHRRYAHLLPQVDAILDRMRRDGTLHRVMAGQKGRLGMASDRL